MIDLLSFIIARLIAETSFDENPFNELLTTPLLIYVENKI